ncbi:MAG: ABC transporter substrate-binding protein [Methanosarcinaceae archaeon]
MNTFNRAFFAASVLSVLILLFGVSGPAFAQSFVPADGNGDTLVSEEELVEAILAYMEAEYLDEDVSHLQKTELKVAAHNCLHVPFGKVVIPVESEPMSGNVLNGGGAPTSSVMYEGLITRDSRENCYDCWLAGDWEMSEDANVWTFHIADGACWHDGVPVSSEDVKFTHDYIKGKKLWLSSQLSRVDHVECPDDSTAVFYLSSAYALFSDSLSHCPGVPIIPKHIWENIDSPTGYVDEEFVGSGPFKFKNRVPGYFEMEANTGYHGNIPYTENVIFKVFKNKDSEVVALQSGEIDVVGDILPAVARGLEGSEDIKVYAVEDTRGYELGFNVNTYPASIPEFRKAIAHSVDRENICSIVFSGHARSTETTFLMPSSAHDFVNPDARGCEYNLGKARELLAEAGFEDIDGDGILEDADGEDLSVTILAGNSLAETNLATVLKQEWEDELGMVVNVQIKSDQWQKEVHENPMFTVAMPYLMHDDADDLCHFGSGSFFGKANWYDYSNPEYDQLVEDIRNTPDREERKQIGYEMQEILEEDVPTVPICSANTLIAYRTDRFAGWEDVAPMYWNVVDIKLLSNIKPVSPDVEERE